MVDIRLHELIGQGIDAIVATQLEEPQSYNLSLSEFSLVRVLEKVSESGDFRRLKLTPSL